MRLVKTTNPLVRAAVYTDIINDRLAKISEFKRIKPDYMTDEIRNLRKHLIIAHQESRIHPDEEHFKKWDSLIISIDAALVKAEVFH